MKKFQDSQSRREAVTIEQARYPNVPVQHKNKKKWRGQYRGVPAQPIPIVSVAYGAEQAVQAQTQARPTCAICEKFYLGRYRYGITCYHHGQLGHMAKACMNMPIQQTVAPASQTTVQMDRSMGRGAIDRERC